MVLHSASFSSRMRQEKGAPVGNSTDDAAGGEHGAAGRGGDFFDLGEWTVGSDLSSFERRRLARGMTGLPDLGVHLPRL